MQGREETIFKKKYEKKEKVHLGSNVAKCPQCREGSLLFRSIDEL